MAKTGHLNLLYVGPLIPSSTCSQRLQALLDLGCHVNTVDTAARNRRPRGLFDLAHRLVYRLRTYGVRWLPYIDLSLANSKIISTAESQKFEVIWIDKGITISASTIDAVRRLQPNCLIAGYSPDDMAALHNNSKQYVEHLRHYDCFFTTKSFNVTELTELGCRRVHFVGKSFDPHTHRVMPVSKDARQRFGGSVGFIGTFERDRARRMDVLVRRGIPVRVWGQRWHRYRKPAAGFQIEFRKLLDADYATAITNFDINLCFLRKANRDLHTSRSVEIPASGGFMLAERTEEHLALFEEGREAEFFDSDEEMVEKTRYYLEHPQARQRIAKAGRERCLRSGYSNHDRLREMLTVLGVWERGGSRDRFTAMGSSPKS